MFPTVTDCPSYLSRILSMTGLEMILNLLRGRRPQIAAAA